MQPPTCKLSGAFARLGNASCSAPDDTTKDDSPDNAWVQTAKTFSDDVAGIIIRVHRAGGAAGWARAARTAADHFLRLI